MQLVCYMAVLYKNAVFETCTRKVRMSKDRGTELKTTFIKILKNEILPQRNIFFVRFYTTSSIFLSWVFNDSDDTTLNTVWQKSVIRQSKVELQWFWRNRTQDMMWIIFCIVRKKEIVRVGGKFHKQKYKDLSDFNEGAFELTQKLRFCGGQSWLRSQMGVRNADARCTYNYNKVKWRILEINVGQFIVQNFDFPNFPFTKCIKKNWSNSSRSHGFLLHFVKRKIKKTKVLHKENPLWLVW